MTEKPEDLAHKLEKLLADQPRELTTTDLFNLLKEQVAQNRRLRERLDETRTKAFDAGYEKGRDDEYHQWCYS